MIMVSDNCEPKYKNLNRISSFSEQHYVTVQLMKQICMNEEYLKQACDKLEYLSPPAVRINLKDMVNWIDEDMSWGCKVNGAGQLMFDSNKNYPIIIDFNDTSLIDVERSSADIVTVKDTNDEYINRCQLRTVQEVTRTPAEYDYSTSNFDNQELCNTSAYIGFNKSKTYYVRPDWLSNWRDYEIPSVCRAQTFTAKKSGMLVAVDLLLDFNGYNWNSNCGSPLYVQIWPTHDREVKKTKINPATNKAEYEKDQQGNILYETIKWPGSLNGFNEQGKLDKNDDRYHPLAQAIFDAKTKDFKSGVARNPTIVLDKPVEVTEGESYAIVLFSPLSEYKHCPCWKGWTRTSVKTKYDEGNAFYSEKNSQVWVRYGESLGSKKNALHPQDFAFRCHIRVKDETTTEDDIFPTGVQYLYLKPIRSNLITHIGIRSSETGETSSEGDVNVRYQYSLTGGTDDSNWFDIDMTKTNELSAPTNILFFRAILWRTEKIENGSDANIHETPTIENITIDLTTQSPLEMYARTRWINPKSSQMLQGSVWGRIYSDFTMEPTVECSVDIIENTSISDNFRIISVDELDEAMLDYGIDNRNIIEKNTAQRVAYLVDNPSILETLKKNQCYVKPIVIDDRLYKLSFTPSGGDSIVEKDQEDEFDMTFAGISFDNHVSSPILGCIINESQLNEEVYSEWVDYTYDYSNDILTFDSDVLINMPIGDLQVSYNRIFLDGLTNEDLGIHINDYGFKDEGLILDYFKEEIIVTEEQEESRRVKLKVNPVDPIRSVILNKNTDNEKKLFENFDFIFDIDTNELVFKTNNDDGSSVISSTDNLEIIYTPNLECDGISLGYHAKRTNIDKQIYIKDSYIEYKV